jgi:hypothetical protein
MTHQPPLPAAAQTPYPIHPAPHETEDGPAFFTAKRGKGDDAEHYTLADRLALPEALSNNVIAIGAAIGLGVAAIAGALLFRRGDKTRTGTAVKSKAARRPATGRAPRTSRTAPGRARANGHAAPTATKAKSVAAEGAYEVSYFARKHGLTTADARAILTQAGADRTKANALAKDRKN